jgi:hypothetical protein
VDRHTPLTGERADDQRDGGRSVATPSEPTALSPAAAELRQLMPLAERYARELVSTTEARANALMLVHRGALDVLPLDGTSTITAAVWRLLGDRQASSAALMIATSEAGIEPFGHAYHIIGETTDGLRDVWHYRVRGCGSGRRLTRQPAGDVAPDRENLPYALFAYRMVAAPAARRGPGA